MHVSTPGIRTVIWPRHLLQSRVIGGVATAVKATSPSFTVSHHSLGLHTTVWLLNPLCTKQKSRPEQNIIITHQPSIILCSNKKHWLLFFCLSTKWSRYDPEVKKYRLFSSSFLSHTPPVTSKGSSRDPSCQSTSGH